jgi:hypothetical protein
MQRVAVNQLVRGRINQEAEVSQKVHTNDRKLDCSKQKRPATFAAAKGEMKELVSPTRDRLTSRTRQGWATWRAG